MSEMIYDKKALFLDRDGVINEDLGYPYKPEHIKFKKGIFEFCQKAIDKGYIIVIITNQAGVAKGYFSEKEVQHLHLWMTREFKKKNIHIAGIYYCPFHQDGTIKKYQKKSYLRKPKPGMILQAQQDLNINLEKSIMVGDKLSDRIHLKELRSIIIKSKYTPNEFDVESFEEILLMI